MHNDHEIQSNPWEQDTYRTGSTRPPKSRSNTWAVLLVVVLVVCGISRLLGVLNIGQPDSEQSRKTISFSHISTEPSAGTADTAQSPTLGTEEVSINHSPQSQENIPQAGGLSLQDIYVKAIDSVVSIDTGYSSGTGVILTSTGYIVTNYHVVQGAEEIRITLNDRRTLEAALVGSDAVSDLAVLRVEAESLVPAELGDSDVLRVGDTVVAIGDPLGAQLHGTMTDGIVSAINRNISVNGRTMTLIQTNAALNSGNSGGPLINCYGQVVGINTMKIGDSVSTAGVEGLGFAIPTTTVKEVVDQLIAQGYVSGRPSLGFTGEPLSRFNQMYYRLPAGYYITQVEPGSNAAQLGIRKGDILTAIEGTPVSTWEEISGVLYTHRAGDTLSVVIYRNGMQYTLSLVLDEAGK